LSDLAAAYLWAQLESERSITAARLAIWERYDSAFEGLQRAGALRRPIVPPDRTHNAHMYYLLLPDLTSRTAFIEELAARGVHAVFHYVPLHTSEAGRRFGAAIGELPVTNSVSERLVRLPLWPDLSADQVARVVGAVEEAASALAPHTVPAERVDPM
jgi:dTDP-4-amino-4,6-dideoxygalactose transaminase